MDSMWEGVWEEERDMGGVGRRRILLREEDLEGGDKMGVRERKTVRSRSSTEETDRGSLLSVS